MRRIALLIAACLAAVPATAAADDALVRTLSRQMRASGAHSGAYVVNVSQGETVFRWKHDTPRVLASNTKLFTTAAALARYGSDGTLGTTVLGDGELDEDGVWRGDLYLRGGGDPTFGTRRFIRRSYGQGATVEKLAGLIEAAGIERVSGRVFGDESRFDSLRGGPESRYAASIWVGPLSGLAFNRGLGDETGRSFQLDPPLFAAAQLDAALERRGVKVRLKPRTGPAGADKEVLASVDSPPMGRLIALTNKPSDNFFAEMLLKDLALQARGRLRPLAREPRLPPAGGEAALRDARGRPEGLRRRLHRVAGDRRPGRDARRPNAACAGALALPGQDGNPVQRERPVRLLRGDLGRHLRLLDPHERRLPDRCAAAAGHDAAGDRGPAPLGGSCGGGD